MLFRLQCHLLYAKANDIVGSVIILLTFRATTINKKIDCMCGFIPVRGTVAASLSSFILLSSSLEDISAAISIHHSCGQAFS